MGGILAAVDWLVDHQVLIAVLVLIALAAAGLAILASRGIAFVRTTRAGMLSLEQPVAGISDGLADAERRMEVIAAGQAELTVALDRVGAQAGELRVLLDQATRALGVIRSPFRYLGR